MTIDEKVKKELEISRIVHFLEDSIELVKEGKLTAIMCQVVFQDYEQETTFFKNLFFSESSYDTCCFGEKH